MEFWRIVSIKLRSHSPVVILLLKHQFSHEDENKQIFQLEPNGFMYLGLLNTT